MDISELMKTKFQITNQMLITELLKIAKFRHYKKGEYILKAGEPIQFFQFLISENGCIAAYCKTNKEKVVDTNLLFEIGTVLCSGTEFTGCSPGDLKALTDVDLISFPIEAVRELEKDYPELLRTESDIAIETFYHLWTRKKIIAEHTALERYTIFHICYSSQLSHVQDKDIAAWLDLTPQTFCKIKKEVLSND